MAHLDLYLPLLILFLAFLLKLTINQNFEIPNLIKAIYELPVSIVFLALSFLAAHAISLTTSKTDALIYCIGIIVVAIINVFLWTQAIKLFYKKSIIWSIVLTAVNYFTTIFILYKVIISFLNLRQ